MDANKKNELLTKCKEFFAKVGLAFKVSIDTEKERIDKLIAFCKDKTTKTIEKFEEAMLVDGVTKVTIEPTIDTGSAIALYAEDGTPVPAPVGEYELSDGRIVVVEQDGIIALVKEKATEELDAEGNPVKKADPAQPGANPSVKEMIERIETVSRYATEVKEAFDAYKVEAEQKISALTTKATDLETKFTESQKFVKESFEILMKEEAKPAVVTTQNPFAKSKPKNIFELNYKS